MTDQGLSNKWNVLKERAGFRTGLFFFLWPLLLSRENTEAMWIMGSTGLAESDRGLDGRL